MSTIFDIRNHYYIGNFTACINKVHTFEPSDNELATESNFYMYLSYLEQKKYNIILNEIDETHPLALQTVKQLALYNKAENMNVKNEIISKLDAEADGSLARNELASLAAGAIYSQHENYDMALKVLHPFDGIACWAARVQLYLTIHRLDLAAKLLKLMQDKEEESTLTLLAMCWYFLATGGEKLREIVPIAQDLIIRNGATTPLILNLQVVALISLNEQDQARQLLNEAYEKDSNNPEILSNMIILAQRNDLKSRYQNQLQDIAPRFLAHLQQKDAEFDELDLQNDFIGQ